MLAFQPTILSRSIPRTSGCRGRFLNVRLQSTLQSSGPKGNKPETHIPIELLSKGTVVYEGPYAKTFKYLKLFSLSSLGLSAALSPFIFILESSLPTSGRIFLAVTAISTTTFSTYLISLFTGPYVNQITRNSDSSRWPFMFSTTSMFLRERYTFLSDQAILTPSERPLTTWKLQEDPKQVAKVESLEAVTTDACGKVLGSWKVEQEKLHIEGKVVRYFNVHPELMQGRM